MTETLEEKTDIIQTDNVYVVSLPRTGTKSLCRMLKILGYNVKHLPSVGYERYLTKGYNAFADTPVFTYSFIKTHSFDPKNKFIYIERDVRDWINSIESVKIDQGYNFLMNIRDSKHLNQVRLCDILAYGEVFGYEKNYDKIRFVNKFLEHKNYVLSILENNVLTYNFSDGWDSICKYLNKPIPNETVPHLNKDIISDNI